MISLKCLATYIYAITIISNSLLSLFFCSTSVFCLFATTSALDFTYNYLSTFLAFCLSQIYPTARMPLFIKMMISIYSLPPKFGQASYL